MFTKTFSIDRHIEELRAELRGSDDFEEADAIRTELEALLLVRAALLSRVDEAA